MVSNRHTRALAKVESALIRVFNDADVHDAKECLRDCLTASKTIRAGHDKEGHIIYEEVPDYPIRLQAGIKVLEWAVGKPTSTSIIANVDATNTKDGAETADLLKLMFEMPAESAAILLKLQEAAARMKSGEVNVTASVPRLEKTGS